MRLAGGGLDEIEDDSDYEDDGDDLATHGDGTRAKDPPFAGIQRTLKLGEPLCSFGYHIRTLTRFREAQKTAFEPSTHTANSEPSRLRPSERPSERSPSSDAKFR